MLVTCQNGLSELIRLCFSRLFVVALSSFRLTANVLRLCAGGGLEFRLPITEVQFIDKCSLFILLFDVIRHAGTTADACT
jgi:hypothetical protein